MDVTYGDKTQFGVLCVENGEPALFGLEWLRKIQLDWHAIKALNISPSLKSHNWLYPARLYVKLESGFRKHFPTAAEAEAFIASLSPRNT